MSNSHSEGWCVLGLHDLVMQRVFLQELSHLPMPPANMTFSVCVYKVQFRHFFFASTSQTLHVATPGAVFESSWNPWAKQFGLY